MAPNVLHIRLVAATCPDVHDQHHVVVAATALQPHHSHNVAQAVHFAYYRHCTVANPNSVPGLAASACYLEFHPVGYNCPRYTSMGSVDADDHTAPCGLAGCSAYSLQSTGLDYTVASASFAHRLAVLDVLGCNSPCIVAVNCSTFRHIKQELTAHALALDNLLVVQVTSATSAWDIDVVDCYCQGLRTYGLMVVITDCRVAADYFGYCCAFL